ncbi:MAG: PEP-CTERM system TPR-repeat protein PrsT, partial [Gammaproteobacteria bacterium]|nr:PEP-CTERM system TPR-repeat protein PrsT [Gammaproteobacteria bacterium]
VARAKQYIQENETKSAEIELKNALKKSPNSLEARFLLGTLYSNTGNGAAAEKELDKARELGAARQSLIVPYARALVLQRKNRRLLEELVGFDSLSEADQMLLYVYRGDAFLNTGKPSEATTAYDAALKIDPKFVLARLGEIKVAANQGELGKVERLISELLELAPDEPRAWSFRGDYFLGKAELGEALSSFSKALELNDADIFVRAKRAIVLVDLDRSEAAKLDVDTLLEQAPNYYMSYFASGRLALLNADYQLAQSEFEQAVKFNDSYLPTYYFLGISQLVLSSLNQAAQNLAHFISGYPRSVVAHKALAAAQFRLGQHLQAKATLAPVVRSFPKDPLSNELMARIEFALGNSSDGIGYLENLVEVAPEQADIHTRIGVAKMLGGQHGAAAESLKSSLDLDADQPETQGLMAFLYIQGKQYEKANRVINEIRKAHPEDPTSWNLEGVLHWNQKNLPLAKASFAAALKKEPGSPGPAHYLASILIQEQKLDEARSLYQHVLELHPNHYKTSLSLAGLDSMENDFPSMEKRLRTVIEIYPAQLSPRLTLAAHLLRYGQSEKALPLLQNIDAKLAAAPSLLALLLEAELATGQAAGASQTIDKLLKEAPSSPYAHYLAAMVHLENRNIIGVRGGLTRSLELAPKFRLSQIAMVRLLVMDSKPKEAAKMVAGLLKDSPQDAEVLALKGWYETQSGQPKSAVSYYQQSLDKSPSSKTVLELAKVQWLAGEVNAAIGTLERWRDQYPEDVVARYGLSAYYDLAGQSNRAIALLEEIVSQHPNYLFALNDLAWQLRSAEPHRALELIEKAVLIAPTMVGVMSTQAMVLMENRQFEKALRISTRIRERFPDNPNYAYYHSLILYRMGDRQDAKNLLKALLEEDQTFDKVEQAKNLLLEIDGS